MHQPTHSKIGAQKLHVTLLCSNNIVASSWIISQIVKYSSITQTYLKKKHTLNKHHEPKCELFII